MLLSGNNIYKLDGKNRFSASPALLKDGRKFYFTKGLEGCILLYPQSQWRRILEKISSLNYFQSSDRKFLRLFFAGAGKASVDSHKRLLLPAGLKKHAGIKSKILLVKIALWWEIWAPERFAKYEETHKSAYERYTEKLKIKI